MIPSAVALLLIVTGSIAMVVLFERRRGSKRDRGNTGPLIGRRGMLIFAVGLFLYLVLMTAIALRA